MYRANQKFNQLTFVAALILSVMCCLCFNAYAVVINDDDGTAIYKKQTTDLSIINAIEFNQVSEEFSMHHWQECEIRDVSCSGASETPMGFIELDISIDSSNQLNSFDNLFDFSSERSDVRELSFRETDIVTNNSSGFSLAQVSRGISVDDLIFSKQLRRFAEEDNFGQALYANWNKVSAISNSGQPRNWDSAKVSGGNGCSGSQCTTHNQSLVYLPEPNFIQRVIDFVFSLFKPLNILIMMLLGLSAIGVGGFVRRVKKSY